MHFLPYEYKISSFEQYLHQTVVWIHWWFYRKVLERRIVHVLSVGERRVSEKDFHWSFQNEWKKYVWNKILATSAKKGLYTPFIPVFSIAGIFCWPKLRSSSVSSDIVELNARIWYFITKGIRFFTPVRYFCIQVFHQIWYLTPIHAFLEYGL